MVARDFQSPPLTRWAPGDGRFAGKRARASSLTFPDICRPGRRGGGKADTAQRGDLNPGFCRPSLSMPMTQRGWHNSLKGWDALKAAEKLLNFPLTNCPQLGHSP